MVIIGKNIIRDLEVNKVSTVLESMGWEITGVEVDNNKIKMKIMRTYPEIKENK